MDIPTVSLSIAVPMPMTVPVVVAVAVAALVPPSYVFEFTGDDESAEVGVARFTALEEGNRFVGASVVDSPVPSLSPGCGLNQPANL